MEVGVGEGAYLAALMQSPSIHDDGRQRESQKQGKRDFIVYIKQILYVILLRLGLTRFQYA